MIIYKDVLTGDEVISDVFDLKDAGDGLWEADCKNIQVGGENFQLEGANASAEGEDADEGGDETTETKLDIAHSFRLTQIPRPDKKTAQAEFKRYAKGVLTNLKETGKTEQAADFQKSAPAALKKILGNWDNYDVYVGESMGDPAMWILVDFREDGITPYATFWKYALEGMKV